MTLLHAYEPVLLDRVEGALSDAGPALTRKRRNAEAALDAAAERHDSVPITTFLERDVPWAAVNAVADEIDAGLIVVGTHGRTGLSRALHGSVAESILRRATRPVLAIHGPQG